MLLIFWYKVFVQSKLKLLSFLVNSVLSTLDKSFRLYLLKNLLRLSRWQSNRNRPHVLL